MANIELCNATHKINNMYKVNNRVFNTSFIDTLEHLKYVLLSHIFQDISATWFKKQHAEQTEYINYVTTLSNNETCSYQLLYQGTLFGNLFLHLNNNMSKEDKEFIMHADKLSDVTTVLLNNCKQFFIEKKLISDMVFNIFDINNMNKLVQLSYTKII